MKNIVIILLLCISEFCYSQNLQYADSMSRAKADIVLSHFDSIHVSKLLYSIDDKYFYILLNDDLCCKEYIVIADSLGSIVKMEGPNKLSRHDKKLLKNQSISFIITIGVMYLIRGYIAARAQLVTFILFVLTIYFIERFYRIKVI